MFASIELDGSLASLVEVSEEAYGYTLWFKPASRPRSNTVDVAVQFRSVQPADFKYFTLSIGDYTQRYSAKFDFSESELEGVDYFAALATNPHAEVPTVTLGERSRILQVQSNQDCWLVPGGTVFVYWKGP